MADDDWIAMVLPAPNASDFHNVVVMDSIVRFKRFPAVFSNPVDMTCMPYRKKASPPAKVNIEKMSNFTSSVNPQNRQ
jgi:hypothetical protein